MKLCPICNRELINGASINEHHLIPKSKKGTDTVLIHKVCHNKIHSIWTETELNQHFHTIERILENDDMQTFVKWVSKKDPEFYITTRDTKSRKSKRRR